MKKENIVKRQASISVAHIGTRSATVPMNDRRQLFGNTVTTETNSINPRMKMANGISFKVQKANKSSATHLTHRTLVD